MPDWHKLVRQRLAGLELDSAEKAEVHAELAGHLEESYEAFCKQGLLSIDAARRTVEQVSDWRHLQRNILAAKRREHPMKKRVHQLWIPGFLTLVLSMVFLGALLKEGLHPRILGAGPNAILFYQPWLLSLPFFGALGSYLSCRAGGSRIIILLASVFPVLALTTAFLLMFPIGFFIDGIVRRQVDFGVVAAALLADGIGWLLLPGAALLMGGLLVQFLYSLGTSREATGRKAEHA